MIDPFPTTTTLSLPLVALFPFQPPEAVQVVAFVDDQDRVIESPVAATEGDALRVTTGRGSTATLAVCATLPLGPLHVSV